MGVDQGDEGIQTIGHTLEALKKAFDSAKTTYGETDPRVLPALTSLAQLLTTTGQYAEAKPLIEQGFSIRAQNQQANADYDKQLYDLRSRLEWAEGRRAEAMSDLRKSLDQIQAFVQRAIGSELDRARFGDMEAYLEPFERMVGWCRETGDVDQGFLAADQYRGRILMEQLTENVDPLAAIPADRREGLILRKTEAFGRATRLENQMRALDFASDLSAEGKPRAIGQFEHPTASSPTITVASPPRDSRRRLF